MSVLQLLKIKKLTRNSTEELYIVSSYHSHTVLFLYKMYCRLILKSEAVKDIPFQWCLMYSQLKYRILHECSCFIEFNKQVEQKR